MERPRYEDAARRRRARSRRGPLADGDRPWARSDAVIPARRARILETVLGPNAISSHFRVRARTARNAGYRRATNVAAPVEKQPTPSLLVSSKTSTAGSPAWQPKATPSQRTTSAGLLSIMPLHRSRAGSYPWSPGRINSLRKPEAKWSAAEAKGRPPYPESSPPRCLPSLALLSRLASSAAIRASGRYFLDSRQRNTPFRSRPSSAKPRSELAPGSDSKLNPSSLPENDPVARASRKRPRKAARSVGGTAVPEPSSINGPVASHLTVKLTVAGITIGGGIGTKVKLSTTGTSSA